MTETATDVDECAALEMDSTNDICVVEMLQPKDTAGNSSRTRRAERTARDANRRRCSVGGKCIWPTSDWLRRMRHKHPELQEHQEHPERERECEMEHSRTRRSSVLLMVLLSGSEMEAKAVVVNEQQSILTTPQPQRLKRTATEEMEDAIDALWL
ncbi:GH16475 [Drosophila grimshawi]|uniref:GH16475 n=3 Tax=Drosophila grimshawi TaxID=7222 RepID=B4J0H6_DROGR|nr:GH16475 [Drosophila grimshawi]